MAPKLMPRLPVCQIQREILKGMAEGPLDCSTDAPTVSEGAYVACVERMTTFVADMSVPSHKSPYAVHD